MKLLRAMQFAFVLCFALIGRSVGQTAIQPLAAATAALPNTIILSQPIRAYPLVHLFAGEELLYLGVVTPDAVFRSAPKFTNRAYSQSENILPASSQDPTPQHDEVPGWMLLQNERVVQSFQSRQHATAIATAPSVMAEARNRFLTCAYGRPSVLHAPHYIATDSMQRLIISDPDGNAVHVLDPKGKGSFRIMSGPRYRLERPAGVAVDSEDNIYVADAGRGVIVVFDQRGNFLREVGTYQGEPNYVRPEGIAIDRARGHVYLVDSPRNLMEMLDLDGHVLKTFGKRRNGTGMGELDDPTVVAVSGKRVFVLDQSGGRVQIMDTELHVLQSFNIARCSDSRVSRASGLGVDASGNVYVSSVVGSVVRAFDPEGTPLAIFGQPGRRIGEFEGPQGLWIDAANRLYVADSGNGRVQMFQLRGTK